jgi:hypothetical protein
MRILKKRIFLYTTYFLLLLLYFFFLFVRNTSAVTISLSGVPPTITQDPFTITVSISGAKKGTNNYLKMDIFQNGSTHYFGFTQNGNGYYKDTDFSHYPQVTINDSGSASATLVGKADFSSSYYEGSGSYSIRVRRYTSSGSYSADESNQSIAPVFLQGPAPSTPTPTPTIVEKQNIQTKSSTPSTTQPDNNGDTLVPKVSLAASNTNFGSNEGQVLGDDVQYATDDSSFPSDTVTPSPTVLVKGKQTTKINLFFIITGLIFLCICAILLFFKYKKQESDI